MINDNNRKNVSAFPPQGKRTAQSVIAEAISYGFEDVVIVGRDEGSGRMLVLSSHDRDCETSWELHQADGVIRGVFRE